MHLNVLMQNIEQIQGQDATAQRWIRSPRSERRGLKASAAGETAVQRGILSSSPNRARQSSPRRSQIIRATPRASAFQS